MLREPGHLSSSAHLVALLFLCIVQTACTKWAAGCIWIGLELGVGDWVLVTGDWVLGFLGVVPCCLFSLALTKLAPLAGDDDADVLTVWMFGYLLVYVNGELTYFPRRCSSNMPGVPLPATAWLHESSELTFDPFEFRFRIPFVSQLKTNIQLDRWT